MSFSYEADLRAFSNSILLWHLALAIFTAAVSFASLSEIFMCVLHKDLHPRI